MEYLETSNVEGIKRSLVYPDLHWLTKSKFIEIINLQKKYNSNENKIHPYLDLIEGQHAIDFQIFIGKSIPSIGGEGVRQYSHYYDDHDFLSNLEVIGTVVKNLNTNNWELNVSHSTIVTVIKENFLVLNLKDSESFYWAKTKNNYIPLNSLRAAVDERTCEYFYVGRSRYYDPETESPQYFRNGHWCKFNDTVQPAFGKVHRGNSSFYAPVNKLELVFKEFDILCLKSSPSSLKILTRSVIRKFSNHSNKNIQNRNLYGECYLPNSLINFVKYPSYLSIGEYMLQDEKIVHESGDCEVLFERIV